MGGNKLFTYLTLVPRSTVVAADHESDNKSRTNIEHREPSVRAIFKLGLVFRMTLQMNLTMGMTVVVVVCVRFS
jgi:hypothetical protein